MIEIAKTLYYCIAALSIIIIAAEYLYNKNRAQREQLQREYEQRLANKVASFIIVPRLPNPNNPNIIELIKDRKVAFILESEWVTFACNSACTNIVYWLLHLTEDSVTYEWESYDEDVQCANKNQGRTFHSISELWSIEYLEYFEEYGTRTTIDIGVAVDITSNSDIHIWPKQYQTYVDCIINKPRVTEPALPQNMVPAYYYSIEQ